MNKITEKYVDLVVNNQNEYKRDYHETVKKVNQSDAVYKGETIPFLTQPIFFTEEDWHQFEIIATTLMSITDKVVNQYKCSFEYRKKFGFSKLLESLILIEHGYETPVPIGRFDIFYGGIDQFKFCEFNTDGSSAMNEDNTLAKIILETMPICALKEEYQLDYCDLFDSWVKESIDLFKESHPNTEYPQVAIVDFIESGTSTDFNAFKKAYEKRGYPTIIADPRDLTYKDGSLYKDDFKIDLVYRRVVTRELIDRHQEIGDFIQAIMNQDVCLIGPVKSQIMHNKIIFKILHDADTLALLNSREQNFIKKHIPLTEVFGGDRVVFDEVYQNKDRYVVKPQDLYASRGVYVGRDFSCDEWHKILLDCFDQDYLYQEFCIPYKRPFVVYQDDAFEAQDFGFITGLYIYNKKLAGCYTRIGKGNVISGLHDYYTVASIISKKR